jgi:hypothetical protein
MEKCLRQIPFMKLNLSFDFEKIKEEVLAIDKWYDYRPPYFTLKPELQALHKNYKHCAITIVNSLAKSSIVREHFAWHTDPNNPDDSNLTYYYDIPAHQRKWYATEMAEKMPTLMNFVLSITDRPTMCKVVKTTGVHGLGWHSHQNDPLLSKYDNPEQCILHIPIIANKDVAHIVKLDMPENRYFFDTLDAYKNDPRCFVENFTPGHVWFFNGYYPHAYKNYSTEERIDILLYSDLEWNPTIREVMTEQIAMYNGPLLNPVEGY